MFLWRIILTVISPLPNWMKGVRVSYYYAVTLPNEVGLFKAMKAPISDAALHKCPSTNELTKLASRSKACWHDNINLQLHSKYHSNNFKLSIG